MLKAFEALVTVIVRASSARVDRGGRHVPGGRVGELGVDLVAHEPRVVVEDDRRETLELVTREDVPGRVLRVAQEQHAGTGPECVAQPGRGRARLRRGAGPAPALDRRGARR